MDERMGDKKAITKNENEMEYEANAALSKVLPKKLTCCGAIKV